MEEQRDSHTYTLHLNHINERKKNQTIYHMNFYDSFPLTSTADLIDTLS